MSTWIDWGDDDVFEDPWDRLGRLLCRFWERIRR